MDFADRGGATLEEIATVLNVTRERIRQIEQRGIRHLADNLRRAGILSSEDAARAPEAVRQILHRGLVAGATGSVTPKAA
ncbi:MAG TPA: sigma factor-like helix-turn-helix DNA-binding protein [Polyangia bacterium]|nr:sigma factor-like helix-turn-helix DNA-binding protein [Polyangia bacterium]